MLIALALLIAGLALIGVAAGMIPAPVRHRFAHLGAALLCAVGLLLAVAFLATGSSADAGRALLLPFGPALAAASPGVGGEARWGTHLRLDALSAVFLLIVFGVGGVTELYRGGAQRPQRQVSAAAKPSLPMLPSPLLVAATALVPLAADAPTFLLGIGIALAAAFGATGLAGAAAAFEAGQGRPAVRVAAVGIVGTGCLAIALGLLPSAADIAAPLGGGPLRDGAAATAAALDGAPGILVLALTLVGAGSIAGLAPFHAWLPPAQAAAVPDASATLSVGAVLPTIGAYALMRILFDLCGPATPAWWGMPLLVLGAASALLGPLRANLESELGRILACCAVGNTGLVTIGLGVALVARGADLLPLATLSLGAVILLVIGHACAASTLSLAACGIRHGAGSQRLDALGGVLRSMPLTGSGLLVAAASMGGLPPLAGFAGGWLLLQALLTAPRAGGLVLQLTFAVAAACAAASLALRAAAMVRLAGIAVLGRPRTPRAAAATEDSLPWAARNGALLGMALACALVGVLPGPILLLADGAVDRLTGGDVPGQAGWMRIAASADAPGYSAPAALVLLLTVVATGALLVRRFGGPLRVRRVPAWDGGGSGVGAPANWLPFGDPATQLGALSSAQPFARSLGRAALGARETIDAPDAAAAAGPPLSGGGGGGGQHRSVRYELRWRDPAEALARAIAAGLAWCSKRFAALDGIAPHRAVGVMFALLVGLLLLTSLAGAR